MHEVRVCTKPTETKKKLTGAEMLTKDHSNKKNVGAVLPPHPLGQTHNKKNSPSWGIIRFVCL